MQENENGAPRQYENEIDTGQAGPGLEQYRDVLKKAARLKANGISDKSICTVCQIRPEDWAYVQALPEYQGYYEVALATVETKPVEINTGIAGLEEAALKQTIYNVQQGYADPAFVLDALKYATKVRLEEKKLEQEKQASFNANTQIVINMNTLLQNALQEGREAGTVVFTDGSKAVVNGLDTDTLLDRAMGKQIEAKPITPTKKTVSSLRVEDLDDILFVNGKEEEDD